MKKILFLFGILSGLFFSTVSSRANTYNVNTGQFDKLVVYDNINVIYKCVSDSSGSAHFECDPEFKDMFSFTTRKGTLSIKLNNMLENNQKAPAIYVYSDFIVSAKNSSNGILTIINPASCPEFNVTQIGNGSIIVEDVNATNVSASINTGNGQITISGNCDKANFKMVGTGVISADRLKARDVNCTIAGTGSIGCWPEKNLDVKGIGTTKIYYKGQPTIKKRGGGSLIELLDEDVLKDRETAFSNDMKYVNKPERHDLKGVSAEDEADDVSVALIDDEEYEATVVTLDDEDDDSLIVVTEDV